MNISVLIVDDEELILRGLRRTLRGYRKEWDVEFANSGHVALEMLASKTYEVIVSDMRMPGMNGNELLAEVKRLYPGMVRIILSGHADKGLILESTCLAHQYLAKPCDGKDLESAIDRCRYLHSLLLSDELSQLVAGLSSVPSLPDLYLEVVQILEDESMDLRDAGDVIERDPGMSMKVLQLVNSAFFGLQRSISRAADAVGYLGSSTLKALVLSTKIFSEYAGAKDLAYSAKDTADRGLRCGLLAQRIAKEMEASDELVDHALLAGALHDVGEMILACNMPQRVAKVWQLIDSEGLENEAAESQILGSTHAEVGAYLLNLWGIPQPIVEAVALHHHPGDCCADEFNVLTAVHIAIALEALGQDPNADFEEGAPIPGLDMEYLKRVGVSDRLQGWAEMAILAGREAS
ncbi:MAG: HD-like signal output (HDOD) protein/ActR/RegA family two-component response regulator [Glaciecola sp.]|jgi:HD-like signal output (HDOD) protein/ActR/RegA family two-component response regulator